MNISKWARSSVWTVNQVYSTGPLFTMKSGEPGVRGSNPRGPALTFLILGVEREQNTIHLLYLTKSS